MSIHIRKTKTQSFSLVEVVLALGVIAFSLVAILGVFPTGLAANRLSVSDTRAAQLANAISATIDAQSANFSSVNCYGVTLDLGTLDSSSSPQLLYAGYSSPNQPTITTTQNVDSIYTIELRFDNNPIVALPSTKLGAGKINKVQIRISGKSSTGGGPEFFYVVRNKG